MAIPFPSAGFFEALQKLVAEDPTALTELGPCDAYCGVAVGDRLFVLEFDGRECAAVVSGGNPLDLDFVLRGSDAAWKDLVSSLAKSGGDAPEGQLARRIEAGALELATEDDEGRERASTALPFLQGFFELARGLDLEFE